MKLLWPIVTIAKEHILSGRKMNSAVSGVLPTPVVSFTYAPSPQKELSNMSLSERQRHLFANMELKKTGTAESVGKREEIPEYCAGGDE